MCTDSPIQSHFTGDTGALPLTVSSRLTTVLLCALIALYRAISLVILGPYHSQCPQGLLLCTDSPIQSHFSGVTRVMKEGPTMKGGKRGRDEGRMVTVQTPIKAPLLCGGCSPRLLLAILPTSFFKFVAGSPLSVDRAMAVLGGVTGRWRYVGTRLGVPRAIMDLIASECTSDSECLRKALRYWIQRDPHASWRRLIVQFDDSNIADLIRVADDVRSLAEELTGQCYSAVPQC